MNEKDKKQTTKKVETKNKKVPVKKPSPKIDLGKEIKKLMKENKELKNSNKEFELKLQLLEFARLEEEKVFKEKAKGFQKKAQEQIEKVKKQLREKTEKDKAHINRYGSQKLFESIVNTILNLELAVSAGKKQDSPEVQAYVIGFEMLLKQLNDAFSENNILEINPKIGSKFDPELHNIIKKNGDSTKIIEVKKRGFKLHNRVIKPADVILG